MLTIAGRSGSSLIQSYLDGHREIAQIPAIWKFHDFAAAHAALFQTDASAIARAFSVFPAHEPLFDTRRSVHVGGALGERGDLAFLVDPAAFEAAMTAALGAGPFDLRRVLYAAVLAYEWCLGRDLGAFRVVFHHLHHGDWLWPDLAPEPYNLAGLQPPPALRAALRPDLLLVSLRAPRTVLRSYPALAAAIADKPAESVAYYELLLRLLAQDWLRARVAAGSGIPTAGVRLEDIKADRAGTLAALCGLLGVDPRDPALAATTYYGHPWTEDNWTTARNALRAKRPDLEGAVAWQDEAFLQATLGSLADEAYAAERGEAGADWNTLLDRLVRAAEDPAPGLFPGMRATEEGRASASSLAWDRISFAERFRALVATQRLGTLRLCQPADSARLAASA